MYFGAAMSCATRHGTQISLKAGAHVAPIPIISREPLREEKLVCWWIHRHTAADRTDPTLSKGIPFHPVPTFEIFPQLACFPSASPITNARLLHKPAFAAIHNCVFSLQPQSAEQERGEKKERKEGVLGLEQGFMTFNMICIIVCISCSVSTQCQHGWSGLISELHHKDKRHTCRYRVIWLPTAHVKLFSRTRGLLQLHEWANCCIMISQESHFNWSRDLLVIFNLCTCM